jgi:hypothetical protein
MRGIEWLNLLQTPAFAAKLVIEGFEPLLTRDLIAELFDFLGSVRPLRPK